MSQLDYDVVICGGGPSGSTCALALKDSGAKVLVIEKGVYPREKVCGDGLAPYIPKILGRISEEYAQAFHDFEDKFPINKLLLRSYNGEYLDFPLKEEFYIATRYHFDNFLHEQAAALPNVTYDTGRQVKRVEVQEDRAIVETDKGSYTAKLVIGCDGITSVVRRDLTGHKVSSEERWATVRAYMSGVTDVDQSRLEVYYTKKYERGYFWVFPSADGLVNIGMGTLSRIASAQKLNLKEVLFEIIDDIPELKERFKNATLESDVKGWTIPVDYGCTTISGDRFMLCGDAASLADPATGEGIGPAMGSGRIAGFHAAECFKLGDFSKSAMEGYNRAIDKKYGTLIKRRKVAEKVYSKHHWTMNAFVKVLNSSSTLKNAAEGVMDKLLA
ncbi:MAG: geranylgeranyl reductase family protein [Oceanospirillaceae bacterium]|nr:geranylgeranyl reductase family protein [Oceanospirillaceae bacterium]